MSTIQLDLVRFIEANLCREPKVIVTSPVNYDLSLIVSGYGTVN
jgi:hypothetical protein